MDVSALFEQVPALAVLVVVVIHFLRHLDRSSKASEERFRGLAEHFASQLDTHGKSVEHLTEEIRSAKAVNAKLAQIIIYHDATVKGENPEAFGDPKEFIDKILRGPAA